MTTAIEALLRDPDGFDCIVTDVVMPATSGYDFVQIARNVKPDIPVVFMSGFDMTKNSQVFEKSEQVEKPVLIEDLCTLIRELLDK